MRNRHINRKLFFNKYLKKRLVNKTSISQLFSGINIKDNEPVAMKFEKRAGDINLLESEAYYLMLLKGFGIPKLITFGRTGAYNLLVMELLGPSLNIVWNSVKRRNPNELLKDICMFAIQGLDRLEFIHSKDIIHRDIKPHNFCIGLKDQKIIYLIDFGFAHKYRSTRTGKHIKFQFISRAPGSIRYMSLNGHNGLEMSRRDDLESFGYMLVIFAKDKLPWSYLDNTQLDIEEIMRYTAKIKESCTPEILCKDLPEEFVQYMKYVKSLEFEQDPDYKYIKGLFYTVLMKNQLKDDSLFIWVKNKKKEDRKVDLNKRKTTCQKILYNKIKNNLEEESTTIKSILKKSNIKKNKKINSFTEEKQNNSFNINLNKKNLDEIHKKNYSNNIDKNIIFNINTINNNNPNNCNSFINSIFNRNNNIPLNEINKNDKLYEEYKTDFKDNKNSFLKFMESELLSNFQDINLDLNDNKNNNDNYSINKININNESNNLRKYKTIAERNRENNIKNNIDISNDFFELELDDNDDNDNEEIFNDYDFHNYINENLSNDIYYKKQV